MSALLIVCEGRETEPNYLNGLCDAKRINRANVSIVVGDSETDALALVRKARRRFEIDRDFDRVFVVCDCESEDLSPALALVAKPLKHITGRQVTIDLIVTRPCFEFWLLLHFEYVARLLPTAGSAIDLLRRHVTDYQKADRDVFRKVEAGLDRAMIHAARLKADIAEVGVRSPDTDMTVLIEALLSLKR
ncbi:MAG: RloB domain-containing protein [Proteobacteria bacterium]|nr:RloB domain-containing protein [Pseudomonadota bacterium]